MAYYGQQGSEAFSKNPLSRETYIRILKAFEAARELRAKSSDNDEDYLINLPTDCQLERKRSDPVAPEVVRKTVAETVRQRTNPAISIGNVYGVRDSVYKSREFSLFKAAIAFTTVLLA